ncbi:MAG: hypothetical protein Q9222_004044 [Ikaeria aurantiellina]
MELRARRHHNLPSETPSVPTKRASPLLLGYDQIPTWHQDNEYIRSGYRPETRSTRLCFASWAYIHNETANIYTHLLPALLSLVFQVVASRFFTVKYPHSSAGDRLVFAFFFLTASICLGISTTYHTLMNHSAHLSSLWLRIDYVGIIIIILGDFVSGVYMIFYCEPILQQVYWCMVRTNLHSTSLRNTTKSEKQITVLGVLTVIILLSPGLQGLRYRTLRACTVVFTGLSGFAPLLHGISVFGVAQMNRQSGMPYYLLEGVLLIMGALFYGIRIPEVLKPGRFDIWVSSHQIFHVLVVAATAAHMCGICKAFDYNYQHRKCLS